MAKNIRDMQAEIALVQYDPSSIQRIVHKTLEDVTDGTIDIVSAANPLVFGLETASVLTSSFMQENAILNRRQYAQAAQTPQDLYYHMADKDYLNRFAMPSHTTFRVLFDEAELRGKMVSDPVLGIRKIIIPRNTYFRVADVDYAIQYPIEIREQAHGGLRVLYNTDKISPLKRLSTNQVPNKIVTNAGVNYLMIDVDVDQFSVVTKTPTAMKARTFRTLIDFPDQYYYTRVYMQKADSSWVELVTTHADRIYDVDEPTAVLKVLPGQVEVMIPLIYIQKDLVEGNLRIDVYTTLGPQELLLDNFPSDAISATWRAYDKNDYSVYTAPLETLSTVAILPKSPVSGGANALSHEELRSLVIKNAVGAPNIPVTPAQIEKTLNRKGYDLVKNVDVVTDRTFLATRNLPRPQDESLLTSAAASIETFIGSFDSMANHAAVIDNGSSMTITPDAIYRIDNGILRMSPQAEVDAVLNLPPENRALVVTNREYLYSPFYYVLDMSTSEFQARAYYLDNPTVDTQTFIDDNDSTYLQVNTGGYEIVRDRTGYKLRLITQSDDAFKALRDDEVFVQLAFTPAGERDRAYLMGSLVGVTDKAERIYEFSLSTTFNTNKDNQLELTTFTMYENVPRSVYCVLQADFDVLYITTRAMGTKWVPNGVDKVLGRHLLPSEVAGLNHEVLTISLGDALKNLWARSRTIASTKVYRRWQVDVPLVYERNIYKKDPITQSEVLFDDDDNVSVVIEHYAGEEVLDDEGEIVYRYRVGDLMVDSEGNPIVENDRTLQHHTDLMLIEGAYWFANDIVATKYRKEAALTMANWIVNDLEDVNLRLLDKSRVFFYPKTTFGTVDVVIADGLNIKIPAGQSFVVTLTVPEDVYQNPELKEQMRKQTVRTIAESLRRETIANSVIVTALEAVYGEDVVDIDVSNFGPLRNITALTILNPSFRCSIRKRLVARPDDKMIVEEDVTVAFTTLQSVAK